MKVDRGGSWLMLGLLCLAMSFCAMIYTTGLFKLVFEETFDMIGAPITLLVTTLPAIFFLGFGPIWSLVVSQLGCRVSMMLGGAVCASGWLLSAFVYNYYLMLLTFGVLTSSGMGIIYIVCFVATGRYFHKKRHIAYSIMSTGATVGIAALPPLVEWSTRFYSWRGACVVVAGVLLHSIAIGAALFPVDQSDSKDLETQTQPLPEDDKLFHWHILKCKPFLVYCVAYYLLTVGTALAFVHWPVFMVKGLGRTSQEAAHVLMSTGLASLVSRPLIGLSQQWINVYYATSICCLINAAAFVCLPLSPLFVLNIIVACVFGSFGNNWVPTMGNVVIDIVGEQASTSAFGIVNCISAVGMICGPFIADLSVEVLQSFVFPFYAVAFTFVIGGVLLIIIGKTRKRPQYSLKEKVVTCEEETTSKLAEKLLLPQKGHIEMLREKA